MTSSHDIILLGNIGIVYTWLFLILNSAECLFGPSSSRLISSSSPNIERGNIELVCEQETHSSILYALFVTAV